MRPGRANRFWSAMARAIEEGRPLVLAHRGDSFHAPENTLDAADLGHQAGAVGWEFDVQLTSDGIPIVLHDASLSRTTNVAERYPSDPRADLGYRATEFSLDEIRRLDAGSWFVGPSDGPRSARAFGTLSGLDPSSLRRFASGSVKVPTLEEALAFTIERDWLANVEIKSSHDGDFRLTDAVVATIERLGAADRVSVSSFDHAEVARVAATGLGVATAILVATPLHRPVDYLRRVVGADAYHVSALALGAGGTAYRRGRSAALLRRFDLAACRGAGVPVLVYTVNESGKNGLADHLAEAGVAGQFTDDPRALVALFTPSSTRTTRRSDDTGRHSDAP